MKLATTDRSNDMAAEAKETVSTGTPSLKYLGFLPFAVVTVTTYITSLYEYAKGSSGPLKPGVDSVEGTVKTVVRPVYQKIEGKPYELLVFLDQKVDSFVKYLDAKLPPKVKETGCQAFDAAKSTVSEVQSQGLYTTAKGYYEKYEPVAETYGVEAYKKALTFPLVPQAVAITRYGALKVNEIVTSLKESGLPLAHYLPLLPVSYFDKITHSE